MGLGVLADLILRPAEEPPLLQDFNGARGIPEIETMTGLSRSALERVDDAAAARAVTSLDTPLPLGGGTLGDMVPSEGASPEDAIMAAEGHREVHRLLDALDPKLREVITGRFWDELTLDQVAEGRWSRERSRQLEREALARMRRMVEHGG